MTRLEELTRRYFPPDSNTNQVRHDKVLEFGARLIEECAKIAENHGNSIGENCWNHENRRDLSPSTCWRETASAIRSLAIEADTRFCRCYISVPADASNVKCAKCNLPLNSGAKQEFNAALPEERVDD